MGLARPQRAVHEERDVCNLIYDFSYMYMVSLDLPEGAATLTLPDNRNVAVFAVTVAENPIDDVELASRLFIRPDEKF